MSILLSEGETVVLRISLPITSKILASNVSLRPEIKTLFPVVGFGYIFNSGLFSKFPKDSELFIENEGVIASAGIKLVSSLKNPAISSIETNLFTF